ncbi:MULTISPECIES: hypothetical protein [Streptomyces]|uniref:hypothetical protein n=1 Tax=Streptomyces TaxID=1883 RepID=UPI00017E8551|nr:MULTISPECIES: hypothetical protein [Streptomyces]AKL64398.1 hypothetical protein M444_01940 [Streptomyces sp. Mg1]EDX20472.1 hypothetical protein SSAG_00263 [Streptomyces sp. Mg1]RPK43117.1 hypothetical protein EES37_17635 [Streptomyces sp. ADI91-18]WSR96914.1 hypothetical protein OG224_01860 [Streptomyces goshikiensis]
MARPYSPGPKQFVFAVGDGNDQQVSVGDPQEAYVAFSAFFRDRESDIYTIKDEPSGQSLALMPGQGVISRTKDANQPRSEHLLVDRGNRYLPSAMLFFENGYSGLDRFGQWLSGLADLDASPETRGAARAATFTTEAEAIEEVARIWAASGCVDPSDQYYVFFDSHGVDDDRAERAELLKLIGFLGIERADAPANAAGGEVWVRTDTRLDVECARWS